MTPHVAKLSIVDGQRRQNPPEMGQLSVRRGILYVLAEVSAPLDEWDNASREIVTCALDTFVTSKLGETNALQAVAEAVNNHLIARNRTLPKEDRIWAGLNVAFVRDEELFLAQAGPALTYIARGASVTRYPKDLQALQEPRKGALPPLGDQPTVKARLARFTLEQGDLIALTASHLPTLASEAKVTQAVRHESPDRVLSDLLALSRGEDFSALVLHHQPHLPTAPSGDSRPVVKTTEGDEWIEEEWNEWDDDEWNESEEEEGEDAWTPTTSTPTPTPDKRAPVSTSPPDPKSEPKKSARAPKKEPPAAPDKRATSQTAQPSEPTAPRIVPGKPSTPAARPTGESRTTTPPVTPDRTASNRGTPQPTSAKPPTPSEPPRRESKPRTPSTASSTAKTSSARATPEVVPGTARPVDPKPKKESSRVAAPIAVPLNQHHTNEPRGGMAQAIEQQPFLRRLSIWLLAAASWLLALLSRVVGGAQRLAPRAGAASPTLDKLTHDLWEGLHRFSHATKRVLRQVLPGNHPDPTPPPRTVMSPPGDGSSFLRMLALMIPLFVLLFALLAGQLLPDGGSTRGVGSSAPPAASSGNYSALVQQAQDLIAQAANVDEATAQGLLQQALALLDNAALLATDPADAERVAALRLQANSLLDRAGTIQRPATTRLVALDADSQATDLAPGAGTLFVVERTRASVYRLLPDQPPAGTLQTVSPLLSAQQRLVEGVIVGTPQWLSWVPAGGGRQHDGLLMLTAEGQMFDFDPSSGVLRQVTFPTLTSQIVAADGYGGNLYLLDPGNRQIWKYEPDASGEYPSAPIPWLNPTGQGQVGSALDIAIDGYIFLLEQSGEVRRFQVGEQKAGFALDPVTPPLSQPVALAKLPPEATDMFIADAQRVVRFDQNGRFLVEYRAPLGNEWGTLRDIALNETGEILYLLSDTGIYWVDIRTSPRN